MKPIPPLHRAAFLFDLDGTLIDIAPTPDAVVVPDSLPEDLRRLRKRCADAVAIVTGRRLEDVDRLMPGVPFAVAGEHGAALRHGPGLKVIRPSLPSAPAAWQEQAEELARRHPGASVEPKSHGFVLHYRAVPDAGEVFRLALETMLASHPRAFDLLPAKMAWEIRPAGINKGLAVLGLMSCSPFAGRVPVYVGDDVTDEDGMEEAERMGGTGLKVGRDFPDPAAVRAWIAGLAAS